MTLPSELSPLLYGKEIGMIPIAFWILLRNHTLDTEPCTNYSKAFDSNASQWLGFFLPVLYLDGLDSSFQFCCKVQTLAGKQESRLNERPHKLSFRSKTDVSLGSVADVW